MASILQCADHAEKPSSSPQRDASGVDTVEFLGHPGGVIEHSIALRRDLATAIRHHRPELVVTLNHEDTWFGMNWNSPDHRNTGRAVLDAIGDAGNRWIFPEFVEQGIEPWRGVRYVAISGASNPTHAVAIESGLERSIRSLEAHARYLGGTRRSLGRCAHVPHGKRRGSRRTVWWPARRCFPGDVLTGTSPLPAAGPRQASIGTTPTSGAIDQIAAHAQRPGEPKHRACRH